MNKQDRQGVRTPADVERKYNLGQLAKERASDDSEQLNRLNQTLLQYMATTNATLNELWERCAEIEATQTWFGSGTPVLGNYPAVDWSDEEKTEHIGDIYCNKDNGNIYLFSETGWIQGLGGIMPDYLDYTVKFMVNGEVYEVVKVKSGNAVNAPSTPPTSESGSFLAWLLNEEAVVFPYTPTGDTELTALFQTESTL